MSIYIERFRLIKLKYVLSVLFLILNVVFYCASLNKIQFYKLYFTIFIFLSIINFLIAFNTKSFFFQKFFSFYMWLAFTFYYFIHLIYFDQKYALKIGNFDILNPLHLKELYLVLIFFFLGMLLSLFVSNFFLNTDYKKKKIQFNIFYKKNINYFYLAIITFILVIFFLNFSFKIFDYYFFSQAKYNSLIDLFLKWFFLFGFSSIYCIFLDIKSSKKIIITLFIISIFQEFLFYFSILSRASIFNSAALLVALLSKYYYKNDFNLKIFFNLSLFMLFLFIFNIIALSNFRGLDYDKNFQKFRGSLNSSNINVQEEKNYYRNDPNIKRYLWQLLKKDRIKVRENYKIQLLKNKTSKDDTNLKEKFKNILLKINYNFDDLKITLLRNRLFGMDSIMAVVGYDQKNFKLLNESLNEKFTPGKSSLFDTIRNETYRGQITRNVTFPTILGFMYYSGSLIFVFFITLFIVMFFNLIEKINVFLNNNIFLSALLSQFAAYRLWHFGYVPINSYKFILSIMVSIVVCFFVRQILINLKIFVK